MQELLTQYPWILILLQLWIIPWKGLALWVAAKKNDKLWFVALLIINTLGILEIFYLLFIAKYKFEFLTKKVSSEKKS